MEERETTKQKTEKKKQKRARSGFWTWVVASVAFWLALVYLPWNLRLSTRPELAKAKSVMSPYAGSMCYGSPLLLLVLGLLAVKRNSYVGNIPVFDEIREKLQEGHNVVLISNHQTEADPAVIALLLEGTHSHIAENVTYVAGDRVVTDPLCKPFSMGRNLVCVYSKKHMFDVPELVEMKRRSNTRSLKEMALLLRGGSQLLWIAPSGGRDRPDPLTGEWYPAPFDSAVVDNMRRLVEHSAVPGHLYPLALLCYDIMPPPPQVEKEIGEKRVITFHGAGLSVGQKIKFNEVTSTCYDSEEDLKHQLQRFPCRNHGVMRISGIFPEGKGSLLDVHS